MNDISTARADGVGRAIKIHAPADFEGMRKAGRLAAETLDFIAEHVEPGVATDRQMCIRDRRYGFNSGILMVPVLSRRLKDSSNKK